MNRLVVLDIHSKDQCVPRMIVQDVPMPKDLSAISRRLSLASPRAGSAHRNFHLAIDYSIRRTEDCQQTRTR
jgi:hypothetical protein